MYYVIYRNVFSFNVESFEMLSEAQDRVKELYEKGCKSVKLSQEIPLKVKVSVEF